MVDSGNFSDHPTPVGDVRTRAVLEGIRQIGYSVVNVGERDMRLGWDRFSSRTEGSSLEFVSANIVDKASGTPIFKPYAVVDAVSADGKRKIRTGVIGVARFNPIFSKPGPDGTTLSIAHPLEGVRAAAEALEAEDVEMTVLLAAMHRDDAARLVHDIPGIDFVLGSYGGAYTQQPDNENGTALIYSGNQGKRVGIARVYLGDDFRITDYKTRLHLMGEVYPADPELLAFVDEIYEETDRLGGKPRTPAKPAVAPTAAQPAARYTGNGVCAECHTEAHVQWASTGHARALETLEKDPTGGGEDCRACHVTALGETGGFTDRASTPEFASVGCETCHGAGRDHAARPTVGYGKVSVRSCTGCHTTRHSPEFDYYTYLTRVSHRESAQASR